jgi:hypothetical protein
MCWRVLRTIVPTVSQRAKEKGLTFLQALDFLYGAEGDRTPDLMTVSRVAGVSLVCGLVVIRCIGLGKFKSEV